MHRIRTACFALSNRCDSDGDDGGDGVFDGVEFTRARQVALLLHVASLYAYKQAMYVVPISWCYVCVCVCRWCVVGVSDTSCCRLWYIDMTNTKSYLFLLKEMKLLDMQTVSLTLNVYHRSHTVSDHRYQGVRSFEFDSRLAPYPDVRVTSNPNTQHLDPDEMIWHHWQELSQHIDACLVRLQVPFMQQQRDSTYCSFTNLRAAVQPTLPASSDTMHTVPTHEKIASEQNVSSTTTTATATAAAEPPTGSTNSINSDMYTAPFDAQFVAFTKVPKRWLPDGCTEPASITKHLLDKSALLAHLLRTSFGMPQRESVCVCACWWSDR
jgi:hypothetical protein